MDDPTWPSEWQRAVLEFAILAVIDEGETYGYVIANRLRGSGFGHVRGGTLYPLLGRLETQGTVQSQWRPGDGGPGRKVYTMTTRGHARLREHRDQWRRFTASVAALAGTE